MAGALSATWSRLVVGHANPLDRDLEQPDWRGAPGDRSPLVLTERNEHLDRLERGSSARSRTSWSCGGDGQEAAAGGRRSAGGHPREEARVILATGKYIGEGFDDSRLDTLFLTLPVSWRGTIAQYAGRLHRLHDGKREVRIYDYADLNVPMLARMFDRRCRGYEAIGYTILLPASAIPGWPADVVLPSDPVWKRDYSGSVRRLVRDGVDVPLASLFVHAARPVPPDADGADRARSATEAFLYRRLETLAETKGRFALNASLPIAFDGLGRAGSRSPVRRCPCGRGVGRRAASWRIRSRTAATAEGSAAAGEWLPGAAVSCGGRGQGTGPGARCHLESAR